MHPFPCFKVIPSPTSTPDPNFPPPSFFLVVLSITNATNSTVQFCSSHHVFDHRLFQPLPLPFLLPLLLAPGLFIAIYSFIELLSQVPVYHQQPEDLSELHNPWQSRSHPSLHVLLTEFNRRPSLLRQLHLPLRLGRLGD